MICNFTIEFNNEGKNIDLYVIQNKQKKYNGGLASGFEKFIINIAIRVVFSKLTCLSKPNIFIIDEMLSSMDNQNKNNISLLFEYLKTQFDIIIVISHLDELKSAVDKIITLSKIDGMTYIICVEYATTNMKSISHNLKI